MYFFLYQKDFSENGQDRYFIYDDGMFSEVSSLYIVSLDCFIITHDFWLISNSLFKIHKKLPCKVIDVVLLSKIVAGNKSVEGDIQPWDISKTIKPLYKVSDDFDSYLDMYYRRKKLVNEIYMLFSHKLAEYYDLLIDLACKAGESNRFFNLELPIYNCLNLAACRGIAVNNEKIRNYKKILS